MNKQKGYTLIELMLAISIMAVASIAAGMAIYQVIGGTEDSDDRITAVHNVQNAGYWISRDAQMAVSINTTETLPFPEFLQISWTEWDEEGSSIYHLIEYNLVGDTGNTYSLKRIHTSSNGDDEETMVADHIYYQPGFEYSSNTSYTNPVLMINLTSMYDDMCETREYRITRRTGL